MSVESYLDSIRKNTQSNSDRTSNLNSTIKSLLNFEALKKAVSAGVEKGNKAAFKRLSELSSQILTSSNASYAELQEVNQLLKLFYAQLQKNSSGNVEVPSDAWIKALADVLDEFGDKLPEKFQNRLKYDIVNTAAGAGADPKNVYQQLNVTQNTQVNILQNIYAQMTDQQKLIERKAEAEKPVQQQKERAQNTFWDTKMGKVVGFLKTIVDGLPNLAKMAGFLAVGVAVWQQLSEDLRSKLQGFAGITNSIRATLNLSKVFKDLKIGESIGNAFSKTASNSFLSKIKTVFAKTGTAVSKVGTGIKTAAVNTVWKMDPLLDLMTSPKIGAALSKVGGLFKGVGKAANFFSLGSGSILGKALPMIAKAMPYVSKILGKVAWPIQVIASTFDFIEGFTKTQGSTADKIVGGLKNVVVKFVKSIWDLLKNIPKWLIKGVGMYFTVMTKMALKFWKGIFSKSTWTKIGSWLKNALADFGKGIKNAFLEAIAGMIDGVIDDVPNWLVGPLQAIREKIPVPFGGSRSTSVSSQISGFSSSPSTFSFDMATGTNFMGRDALNAAMPLNAYTSGNLPSTAQGVRTSAGVRLSSQTADFIKRAGLTNTVTSGMEGSHRGDASNPRSHYSGNKFDYAVNTNSATSLANELRKMFRTPGIKEIRTEAIPSSVVEAARAMLEGEGYRTKGVLFNDGYPSYATGPHLDVLIDPKFSGVQGTNQNLTTSMSTVGEGVETNPLVASLKANITKALNEQSKLLTGVLAPDSLNAARSKDNTAMLANAISGNSSKGVTFNKKNDITDANLATMQLVGLI